MHQPPYRIQYDPVGEEAFAGEAISPALGSNRFEFNSLY